MKGRNYMKSRKVPLYIHIMEVIKEKIISGEYPIGSFLPTENELEEQFKVSKITVRNAIELLEGDGYVSKRSGKGTTVISNAVFNKLSKGETFTKVLQEKGLHLRKEKTNVSSMKLTPQDELYPYFKDTCTKITRLYYLEGEPYIYYTYYLPGDLHTENPLDDEHLSIYMELYKHKHYVKKFQDEFYIDYPSLKILEALHVEQGPLLGRKRMTIDMDDQVIEVSYAQYNTKIHNYVINFTI